MSDSVKKVDAFYWGFDSAEAGAGYSELEIHKFKTKKSQPKLAFFRPD
jgi:hypothetical protein